MTLRFRFTGILLAVFLSASGFDAACAETEPESIAKSVHVFLRAWQANDPAAFASQLHDDLVFAYPGGRLNKAELVAMFKEYQKNKRDIRIYLWDQVIVQGDSFATAYQFAATDRASGRRQAVGTGVAGQFRDGKIVLFKEYYDEAVAIEQYAGRLPLDEGQVSPWPASVWLRPDTID